MMHFMHPTSPGIEVHFQIGVRIRIDVGYLLILDRRLKQSD